jgi:hypothetical protein
MSSRPSSLCPAEILFCPSALDEIDNAARGPAVRAAVDMRIEQIVKHGHDAEHDSMLPVDELPRLARQRLAAAIEQISGTGEKQNLPVARKNLARTAAMCMAAIDRIDVATRREDDLFEGECGGG